MSQLPSMPVWISDFFSKTDHLSNEEQWAYLKLMMKTWVRNCKPIPDNDRDIARLLDMSVQRWRSVRPRIAPFFDLSEHTWRQWHLEEVFKIFSERNDHARSRASAGGRGKARKFKELSLLEAETSRPFSIVTKTKTKERDSPNGERQSGKQIAEQMIEIWNRECGPVGLRTVTKLNKGREAACRARFKQDFSSDFEQWRVYVRRVISSSFLLGGAGFAATFDWVLSPTNLAKVIEGNYDDRHKPANGSAVSEQRAPTGPPPEVDEATFREYGIIRE